MSFVEKVREVNKMLQKGEPDNWSADHKGYSGYNPQHVIDAVNSEFCGDWSLLIVDKETYDSGRKNKSDSAIIEAFVHIRMSLGGQAIDAMASHPILDDYGDAMKSAQTDAMKKAFAHFSIGSRAYRGLLKK